PGACRPYNLGEEMGDWVNNSDGVTSALGKVYNRRYTCELWAWPPGDSVFPDCTNPRTAEWWTQMCLEFKDVLDYNGIWINKKKKMRLLTCVLLSLLKDMNEPSNFLRSQYPGCAVNDINNPLLTFLCFVSFSGISDRSLAQKTLCPDSKTYFREHYNAHSLFGWSQTASTFHVTQQATGKQAIVLSRSTFVGSGKHGGHWLGDEFCRWKDMHQSIIGILEFNLFGIPYDLISADICGFNYNTAYYQHWLQLGSFYPFSRNHN
ncbi:MGA protein, partial [Fregetta grallaria]|nr:MGA protein [Fregetta grallaria]